MLEKLKSGFELLKINTDETAAENFIKYMELLLEWNEKVNLTAITEPEEVVTKHFLDCVTPVAKNMIPQSASVIDVGCGAGFPGLPIKLVRDDIKLTLLDSLAKRLNFIDEVLKKTEICDVTLVHSRAEDGGRDKNHREKYDVALSRAVANMSVLCEYCLPFVKVGGVFIALKGPAAQEEISAAEKAIKLLGGELEGICEAEIPFTDLRHNIVTVRKIKKCPKEYPRKAGTPSKKPIG